MAKKKVISGRACLGPVRAAVGAAFSDTEIDDALQRLAQRFVEARRADPAAGAAALWQSVAAREARDTLVDNLVAQRFKKVAVLARRGRDIKQQDLQNLGLDERQIVRIFNVGDEGEGRGRGRSADAQGKALSNDLLFEVSKSLEDHDLLAELASPLARRDKAFEDDLVIEFAIKNGGKETPTGNARAVRAAQIFADASERARQMLNQAGAFVGKIEGWHGPQRWDPIKTSGGFWKGMGLTKAASTAARTKARDHFVRTMLDLLDERTFEGVPSRTAFLRRAFADIVSGVHETHVDASDVQSFAIPGALARQVSARRVFHFKSAAAAIAANEKFGRGTVLQNMLGHLEQTARQIALLRVWGPNPEAAFAAHLERATEKALRRGDTTTVRKLRGWLTRAEFDQLTGQANVAGSPRLHAVVRSIKKVEELSKLGAVVISALSDPGLAADSLRRAGVPLARSYGQISKSLAGLDSAGQKQAARLAGAGLRYMIGDLSAKFAAADSVAGGGAKATALFYRLNFFTVQQTRVRHGVGALLSMTLGEKSHLRFENLDAPTRETLLRYDLDAPAWQAVRAGMREIEAGADGLERYITPEAADLAPADALRRFMGDLTADDAKVERARRDLRERLQAYFSDQIETALTEPRARERAILRLGTRPGTALGAAVDLITQFKQFPLTAILRHTAPAVGGFAGLKPLGMAAHLIVSTTVLGIVALQLKQIAKGRTPRPLDGRLVLAAFLQGGGAGIYGDFLFADYNRFGRSALSTVSGPAVGDIEGMMQVLSALRSGDDPAAKALRLAIGDTPFINLFYTRAALDYLVLYQMQEMVSPGYLRRYERNVEKYTGSKFLLSPSAAVR